MENQGTDFEPLPENHNSGSSRLLLLAGLSSVFTAVVLIALKLVAWLMTGSVSLLASLIDSVMDSLASLVNLLAIRYALEPPDTEHRFGHGKAEALAGLGQSVLIGISSFYLGYESIQRLMAPEALSATGVGVLVMVISTLATLGLIRFQRYVIARTRSTAISADSLHYVTDVAVNISVIMALAASFYGVHWLDGAVGLVIAFYILRAALQIGHEAIQLLLDHELPAEVRREIVAIVNQHPAVLGCHDIRTRESGRTWYVQLHVEMDENLTLRAAHDLGEVIREDITRKFAEAEVLIHHDPVSRQPSVPMKETSAED